MTLPNFFRPRLQFLPRDFVERILDEAFDILATAGIQFENPAVLKIFAEHGLRVDEEKHLVYFPHDAVEKAIQTAPKTFSLFDVRGEYARTIGGDEVTYDPGSAALKVFDAKTGKMRQALSEDYAQLSRLVEHLDHIKAHSTALVPSDVPVEISDSYRLYLALTHCHKPLITGIFQIDSQQAMLEMLRLVRGGSQALRDKPLAIFDCCPSSPLRWSNLTSHSLIECAKAGVPAEIVTVPLAGATSPITLSGSTVQHAVETLAGLTLAQLVNPGAPVVFGGAASIMDMKTASTPFGSIESTMLTLAYVEVAKYLGLPTHAYLGLSDSKTLDLQAGYETYQGILFAALAGINIVSGVGILDYISCHSFEKLVIDNELCGMAYRLMQGLAERDRPMAKTIIAESRELGYFLEHPTTMEYLRDEQFFPANVVDRTSMQVVNAEEPPTRDWERAAQIVTTLLAEPGFEIDAGLKSELLKIMGSEAKKFGMEKLPIV
ncbi:MAG: trimethylamine methyltransferase family protein [candidate division KSB1 bacterium]|nr:trimethylamine methyltransferase family protein [candidate division KSB1 bacterium]MDZ7365057.1 trimethylamine methyltransferase family protein [candidate division KSB1 bacterium]MDZ7403451.1 trimethylamine methyltransferase family protein [candidate division KSB1 bacterium]